MCIRIAEFVFFIGLQNRTLDAHVRQSTNFTAHKLELRMACARSRHLARSALACRFAFYRRSAAIVCVHLLQLQFWKMNCDPECTQKNNSSTKVNANDRVFCIWPLALFTKKKKKQKYKGIHENQLVQFGYDECLLSSERIRPFGILWSVHVACLCVCVYCCMTAYIFY